MDVNVHESEISVLSDDGALSILELDTSSFSVVMRSHQDEIIDICHNQLAGMLVSIGKDSSVKVWSQENLEQIHEFNTSPEDPPTKVASSKTEAVVAVGFKSGLLRLFSIAGDDKKVTYEHLGRFDRRSGSNEPSTQIFSEAPAAVTDIQFSDKFMAVFYKNAKIVIFNVELEPNPVKLIDYEFPNSKNFSLAFSPNGAYLANISSNANTITIWETRSFSLKWYIDLTGDTIAKLMFAPNGQDLLALTTSAKIKYLRVNPLLSECEAVRDQFNITELEPTDFTITPNNKFIIVTGSDGHIKVYDYFMRGQSVAA